MMVTLSWPRAIAALALALSAVSAPVRAAVLVGPGPVVVIGANPAAAAAPGAAEVAVWTDSFRTFLRASKPQLSSVAGIASVLARFDARSPQARMALAPLAGVLDEETRTLLAPPAADAGEAELESAALKLKVLNFPAVRGLLPETVGDSVGAAAWAYNDHLWDRKGRDLAATIEGIAARLRETRLPSPFERGPAPGPGPDVEVSVLTGDISQVPADAMVATVDEAGLCRGGVGAAIDRAGGCYRAQLQRAQPLREGQTLLARPKGAGQAAFHSVLFVSDERVRPLDQVVLDGLRSADKAGLASVSLPALRTGSVFGKIEKSADEVVSGLRRGVELFLAEGRGALRRISFVVHNDGALAEKIHAAFKELASAPERERSLRTDLRAARLSGAGYTLSPRPAAVTDRSSPIYATLLKPWSLSHLMMPHTPVPIGVVADRAAFSGPTPSVLNMPIKMPGTDVRVPAELAGSREFLQKVIDHEKAVNPDFDQFYAYFTVDQNQVSKGETHRRPGVHIDGVQGARYKVKLPPEHLYSASDALGTVFYDQAFDLRRLDPARQHVHAELERQAKEENARAVPDFQIAFWDSYSVHRAAVAPESLRRTFVRVEFSRKVYDSTGDTRNPLFDYDWERVARPIPADLDDKPLPPEGSEGYRPEIAAIQPWAKHTVKDLRRYLEDNLGATVVRAAKAGKASFLIAVGEGRETPAAARSLGWTLGRRVEKREGYHQVFEARDPDGKKGYVIQRVNGEDRVLHVQSLLKLAGAPSARVRTAGASVSWREHYRRVFETLGPAPDLVVYGFANTSIDAMLLRNAFKNGRHFAALQRNYFKKKAALAGGAEGAHDLDGLSMQALELADGRRIWLFHCMFGDLARDLVGAAVDHGAKNVAFIGSAGALSPMARSGELVIPAAYRRADGSTEALDRLPGIPDVPRRGVYLRVPTPNVGTLQWVKTARASGVDLIESELGYVLDELKDRPDVRLQVALVIAEAAFGPDGRDMTEWGLSDLRALIPGLNRVLDAALGARGEDYIVKKYSTVALGEPPRKPS